ncbi:MAG: hypothetical protein CJD30_11585 [Sulfuricurvum sp. PD_MW2]|jgi:hypothetical protein|uniref:hypothetical protein n=1 Tax=Sulfuricurvum sp. PD_MW2 TaxID=2027917 RepID=UPI000C06230F|nr:hypothetical protein [Sulfuricurvum sp. PD_MW2]PHM16434.1 MAG: hypothetical protein CJD30_11585 [Sulfuricurvum sp. PD_MW2]
MKSKTFSAIFLASSIFILVSIFSFTILVDPYDVTGINLLHIKHKLTRDGRLQKINRIKELKSIDNLILGSSRSERLNPDTVNKLIGGYTYTFGVGGAGIEDALGLLLYLEKEQKLPKNIILCLDFISFGEGKPSEGFYKIPELNFLNSQNTNQNYAAKLFSIDALRASFKTFKIHMKHIEPNSYIDQNGFLKSKETTPSGDMESIKRVADYYYNFNYKKGDIQFSKERFEYLNRIVIMSQKHHISLYAMLTPEHAELYRMVESNPKLFHKLGYVKQKLSSITPYYDAMILNEKTTDSKNFEDAVHYNEQMGNYLLEELLTPCNNKYK